MRLSVCIITYNHEAFIEKAVASVLEQEVNFEYEVVIGEDCSTDSTASILKEIQKRNPGRLNLKYHKPNIGPIQNLFNTISACKGEYVAFLEGDDYWTSRNKLQLQVDFLDKNRRASCVFHRTRAFSADDLSLDYVVPSSDPPAFSSFDFLLQDSNPIALGSLVTRRACLSDIRTWLADIKLGDWPLCLMLASQGDLGFIPLEMSCYRVHPGGMWTRLSPLHRVALTIRMLQHVSGLATGEAEALIERRKSHYARWWAGEIVAGTVSIESVVNELDGIANFRLSNALLGEVVSAARQMRDARHWHEEQANVWKTAQGWQEEQANAWRVAATRAQSDASEASKNAQQLWSTIQEQHAAIQEQRAAIARSAEQIRARDARIAELQSTLWSKIKDRIAGG